MIELSTIRDLVAIFGVIAGFSYYVMTVRNAQKTRQSVMLSQLHDSKYNFENMRAYFNIITREWTNFEDYMEKYGPWTNPEQTAIYENQMSHMDGLALLIKDKTVDFDSVYQMMGRRILTYWIKCETVIKGLREMEFGPGPDYCTYFEEMANMMMKKRKKENLPLYSEYLHPTSTLNLDKL